MTRHRIALASFPLFYLITDDGSVLKMRLWLILLLPIQNGECMSVELSFYIYVSPTQSYCIKRCNDAIIFSL